MKLEISATRIMVLAPRGPGIREYKALNGNTDSSMDASLLWSTRILWDHS